MIEPEAYRRHSSSEDEERVAEHDTAAQEEQKMPLSRTVAPEQETADQEAEVRRGPSVAGGDVHVGSVVPPEDD
ncbi:hypothetical protein U1Q18_024958 [Sarracenia purpurea var. burkii]